MSEQHNNKISLEIHCDGNWVDVGSVLVQDPKKSVFSSSTFDYDLGYYFNHTELDGTVGSSAVALNLPLDPTITRLPNWHSFLLDMIPQGPARQVVCKRQQIIDTPENDFEILRMGAVNPIGNIRVKNSYALFSLGTHLGFDQNDIIEKNEEFLEHAQNFGAIVVGTSGAQGAAPKFLLDIDQSGKWHCDGALADHQIKENYLVKFPRGKNSEDRLILEAEKIYMDIAAHLGLHTNVGVFYKKNVLFVPRFDRKILNSKVTRFGVESISSATGHHQFGLSEKIESYLQTIKRFSSNPKDDMLEFIARDFLNIVMGNSDNHGRNTAFIKKSPSDIRLSPLYDFAPMIMDSEMIARSSKWINESNHIPDFSAISEYLMEQGISKRVVQLFLKTWCQKLETLPVLFKKYKLHSEVIRGATRKYLPFMNELRAFLEK